MANVWAVRADFGKYAQNFVDGGYAAVGWLPHTDLTEAKTRDETRAFHKKVHPDYSPAKTGAEVGMIYSFLLGAQPGDYVITLVTEKGTGPFYFGQIEEGDSYYAPDANDGCPFPHRRRVSWSKKPLSPSEFSADFQKALKYVQRTVFRFRQNEELLARFEFERVRPFLETNHRGVVTTRQADGAAHASIVVCGAYKGNAAFVAVHGRSAKVRNLRRDPACTVLAVTVDWRAFVSVEGQASLFDASNTDAEKLRVLLREVYRACGDKDHPDWEEYDQAMVDQRAVVVLVRPERMYGLLR